ncbi:hypothetical protein K438DRAFT_1996296 [Mycena galopus ATCC 62051]|nr:hypothetical protein K438DRAFT_1996296 [Mycena galopus ATCC 62051]
MEDNALESAFEALRVATEPPFYPRLGFEYLRGSETHSFYVVTEGRVPGIYTHWVDAAPQVAGFSNSVYKKHRGWVAATTACDTARRPHATAPVSLPVAPLPHSTPPRRPNHRASTSARSTPIGSRQPPVLYVYSRGNNTTIYADQQEASSAARRGLADGSFRKVEATTCLTDAFDLATESALDVVNISDFSDSE